MTSKAIGHVASAKVVQVIRMEHQRGRGTADDPLRYVVTWLELNGEVIYEDDPEVAALKELGPPS